MKYYKQLTENSYIIKQEYDDGRQRQVSEIQSDYVAWLAENNSPEEIPYTPPPLPALNWYKNQKKQEIGNQCIADLMILFGSDSDDSLKYDLINVTAIAAALLDKSEKQGLVLTNEEESMLNFLRGLQSAAYNARQLSDTLKSQVDAAIDHAAVDAVIWE